MFGTIVVGVDGSGQADHAVQTVAKMAAAAGDKVVAVHAVVVHLARGVATRPSPRPTRSSWLTATWRSSPRRESPPPARCTRIRTSGPAAC